VEAGIPGHRTITAWLLTGLLLSLVLGLIGCGTGGSDSATRPSTERSGTRPEPSGTESSSDDNHGTDATTPDHRGHACLDPDPTTAERPSSPTTTPERSAEALAPISAPTTAAAGTPTAAESEGLGALGWTLLILLVVALAARPPASSCRSS
jgi:hypothetical protein